jgi:hypothetical protein
MNITELHTFLEKWRSLGALPTASGWPSSLYLSPDVWQKFKELMSHTRGDGHEYAVNLFYVDGEIIVTPYTKGDRESVNTRDSIEVKFDPKNNKYYEKQIYINSKLLKRNTVEASKVPKKLEISYLFNVHTHPIQKDNYSFFSDTDMRTFLASSAMSMGLLTDQLWLIGKTNSSLKLVGGNGVEMLYNVSNKIFAGENNIDSLVRESFKDWGLVFYRATAGNNLHKL